MIRRLPLTIASPISKMTALLSLRYNWLLDDIDKHIDIVDWIIEQCCARGTTFNCGLAFVILVTLTDVTSAIKKITENDLKWENIGSWIIEETKTFKNENRKPSNGDAMYVSRYLKCTTSCKRASWIYSTPTANSSLNRNVKIRIRMTVVVMNIRIRSPNPKQWKGNAGNVELWIVQLEICIQQCPTWFWTVGLGPTWDQKITKPTIKIFKFFRYRLILRPKPFTPNNWQINKCW